MARLKIEPEAVDLMLTALSLLKKDEIARAGHFAFSALGRVLAKNLPDEEGPTTLTNFTHRLEEVWLLKELPPERKAELAGLWGEIKQYLGSKPGYIPTHRLRKIKTCVDLIREIFEERTGVQLADLLGEMTLVDRERLQAIYTVDLMPEAAEKSARDGFTTADFDTIFVLKKALENFGVLLRKKMDSEKEQLPGPEISNADYTSAYVTATFAANPLKKEGEEASFRVLASNDLILAGLHLGISSRATRERYYALFLEGKLDRPLEALDRAGAEILDAFWFYNLENRLPIEEFLAREKEREETTRRRAEEAREKLNRLPYTWDILLPTRVWTREEACARGAELADDIWRLYPPIREIIQTIESQKSEVRSQKENNKKGSLPFCVG
ncbi:MAG: hypothetical protein NTV79_11680 [Candidatus Aureabacteria bacterium]|nr:hypothetical protein [Candidatus Auribacterota bacterium]